MIGFVMSMMIEIKARGQKNRKVDKHESGQNHCEENSWVCAGSVMEDLREGAVSSPRVRVQSHVEAES